MYKYLVGIIGIASSLCANAVPANEHFEKLEPIKNERTESYPYIGLGGSAAVIIPYGVNLGVGSRMIKPGSVVGFDGSLNFTSTFVSHYFFAKGMIPLHLNPTNPKNSYFVGPFATTGVNTVYSRVDDRYVGPKGNSLLSIVGIGIGKNMERDGRVSFWQFNANIRRFQTRFKKTESTPWPTWTFQYGIGF